MGRHGDAETGRKRKKWGDKGNREYRNRGMRR
jgi:hypothetical protein